MVLNFSNIEDFIFLDKNIQKLLPEFSQLFKQYNFAKSNGLKSIVQQSVFDLLNSLTKENIEKLENYFKDTIIIEKLDYHLVKNYESSLNNIELCSFVNYQDFCLYRDDSKVYITFWK
jgi:hypothetical protein